MCNISQILKVSNISQIIKTGFFEIICNVILCNVLRMKCSNTCIWFEFIEIYKMAFMMYIFT